MPLALRRRYLVVAAVLLASPPLTAAASLWEYRPHGSTTVVFTLQLDNTTSPYLSMADLGTGEKLSITEAGRALYDTHAYSSVVSTTLLYLDGGGLYGDGRDPEGLGGQADADVVRYVAESAMGIGGYVNLDPRATWVTFGFKRSISKCCGTPWHTNGEDFDGDYIHIHGITTNTMHEKRFTDHGNWTRAAPINPIPLPAALPLFGSALGLMGFIGWKRKKAA